MDEVEVGARMGMDRSRAMTYDKRSYASNRSAYSSVSTKIRMARAAGSFKDVGFDEVERAAAMGQPGQPTT